MEKYDAIVLGVGAMGSAACYHLAKRGCKTLGIEQFRLGHDRGSSHGETRIIRKAYFEHPDYVPLLNRAYDLWERLEEEERSPLFVKSGLVIYGDPARSDVYRGTLESAEKYGIPVEKLSCQEALERFPMYRPPSGSSALFEPAAGFLHVEKACSAHVSQARKNGAVIREEETVLGYEASDGGVRVRTGRGTYWGARLVIAGGAWSSSLLKEVGLRLELHRLIQYWFEVSPDHDPSRRAPCFVFHLEDGFYYGFPSLDGPDRTIKIASHFSRDPIQDPASKAIQEVPEKQLASMRAFIRGHLPHVSTDLKRFAPCIYTMTPDENFVTDSHPTLPNAVFAAGFSGHGFKFASVMGEILADLALEEKTRHPIDFLRLREAVRPDRHRY